MKEYLDLSRLFCNKKAMADISPDSIELMLKSIIGLLLGAITIGMLVYSSKAYATTEIFDRVYLARDLALINDAINSIPGDVLLEYKETTENFLVETIDEKVYVKGSGVRASHRFIPKPDSIDLSMNQEPNFFIIKDKDNVIYTDDGSTIQKNVFCGDVELGIFENIIIEYSQDNSYGSIREYDVTSEIADNINEKYVNSNVLVREAIYGSNARYTIEAENQLQNDIAVADLFLSLHFSNQKSSENLIVVKVNSNLFSRYVGCKIVSSLINSIIPYSNYNIQIVDATKYDLSDSEYILNKGENVVYVDIGNIELIGQNNVANYQYLISEIMMGVFDEMQGIKKIEIDDE